MPEINIGSLVTIGQAAKLARVNRTTIYRRIRDGRLPVVTRIGERTYLRPEDVNALFTKERFVLGLVRARRSCEIKSPYPTLRRPNSALKLDS